MSLFCFISIGSERTEREKVLIITGLITRKESYWRVKMRKLEVDSISKASTKKTREKEKNSMRK